MKQYIVDTNIILRLLLNDHPQMSKKAAVYFEQAKEGTIKLILIPQIIFEIEYVLRKLYKVERHLIADTLSKLIKTPYISILSKPVLIQSIDSYSQRSVDLVDCYIYHFAHSVSAEVLSFDKDLKKI